MAAPRAASVDLTGSNYAEMRVPSSDFPKRASIDSVSSKKSFTGGSVKIFNDPDGFTAYVCIDEIEAQDVFTYLSDPQVLINLSPSVICLSSKDNGFPERKGRQLVELSVTFHYNACFCCRTVKTMDAVMRVERQSMSVYLTTRPDTNKTVTHHLTVEGYDGGARVVNKVVMPMGCFRTFYRKQLQQEQVAFLTALHDTVKGLELSRGTASIDLQGGLLSPLLTSQI